MSIMDRLGSRVRFVVVVLATPFVFVWALAMLVRYGPPEDPPEYERDCGWWG